MISLLFTNNDLISFTADSWTLTITIILDWAMKKGPRFLEGSFNLKRVSHVIMYISRFSAKMIKFKMKLVYSRSTSSESDAIIYDLFCYNFSPINKYNMIKFFCIISQWFTFFATTYGKIIQSLAYITPKILKQKEFTCNGCGTAPGNLVLI